MRFFEEIRKTAATNIRPVMRAMKPAAKRTIFPPASSGIVRARTTIAIKVWSWLVQTMAK